MPAATRGELDGDRRDVDAEREFSQRGERVQVAARPAAHVEDRTADVEQQLLLDSVGPLEVAPQRQRNNGPVAQPQAHLSSRVRGIAGEHQTLAVEAQRRNHAASAVIAASDEAKREPGAARATRRASSIVSTSRSGG